MDISDETLEARLAQTRRREYVKALRKREWVVLIFFLAFALLCLLNLKRVVVHGNSMYPTFHNGQTVIVWKTVPRHSLKPGDVIVFQQGRDELIKRIAFIQDHPGSLRFPALVTMPNGARVPVAAYFSPLFSPYIFKVVTGRLPKPSGQNPIYVLGDNLPVSDDSRNFGPISPQQILGKVVP